MCRRCRAVQHRLLAWVNDMKQPKRLTLEQKQAVSAAGYLPDNWQLEQETEFYLKIVHRLTGTRRTVDRYGISRRGERI